MHYYFFHHQWHRVHFSVWEGLTFLRSHNTISVCSLKVCSRPSKSLFFFQIALSWASERHYLRRESTYIHFNLFHRGVEGIFLMWKTWKFRVPTRVKFIFLTCVGFVTQTILLCENKTLLWCQNRFAACWWHLREKVDNFAYRCFYLLQKRQYYKLRLK